MEIGVDIDVCKKTECYNLMHHLTLDLWSCKYPIYKLKNGDMLCAGNHSCIPDDCPNKNLHIISGEHRWVLGYTDEGIFKVNPKDVERELNER